MINYVYSCEINLRHPHFLRAMPDEAKKLFNEGAVTAIITSRPFQDSQSVYSALEADINERLKLVTTVNKEMPISRINETNPLHLASAEFIEKRKTEDADYAKYVGTWDDRTMVRVTCTTEALNFEDDGSLIELPSDESENIFKFYVRSFDDGLTVPNGSFVINNYSSTIH